MRIFNEDKTKELNENEIDVNNGYLKEDKLFIKHHEEQQEVQEQSHQELIEEYPESGGKVYEKVIDVPYQPYREAYDEYENILVYTQYKDNDKIKITIAELKEKLSNTDWIVIKIAEAETEEQKQELRRKYQTEIEDRKSWRNEINILEERLTSV